MQILLLLFFDVRFYKQFAEVDIKEKIVIFAKPMQKQEQEYLYTLIGNQIKKLRKKSRFSQEQLAKKLDLSRASIVNIEKGRQHPSLHLLIDLSRILNVSISSLVNDDLLKVDMNSHRLSRIRKQILQQVTGSSGKNINTEKILSFIKLTTQKP